MKTNHQYYNFEKSLERVDEILNLPNDEYKELNYIPSESQLTYTNGFYVNATSLFVDLRDSTRLSQKHTRPVLAKIYRSFISEVIAIMNGNKNCKYIHIDGDCVSGVYDTPYQSDIYSVLDDAIKINTLIKILSCKFKRKGYSEIKAGIGIDYGRLLFIKTGYKGSGLNDVAWMGNALNISAKLSGLGSKNFISPIVMTDTVFNKVKDFNKKYSEWFYSGYDYNLGLSYYHGNVIKTYMNDWYEKNCE
jgi:class 3 adenylate cyclase